MRCWCGPGVVPGSSPAERTSAQRRNRVRELCDLISESSDERDDLRIGADDLDSYELVPKIR